MIISRNINDAAGFNRGQEAPFCDLELTLVLLGWVHMTTWNSQIKTLRNWQLNPELVGRRRTKYLRIKLRRDGTHKHPNVQYGVHHFRLCTIADLVEKGVIDP